MAKATTNGAKAPVRVLAKPGDPLVLANGSVIQDPKARAKRLATLKTAFDPADFRPAKTISSKELPAPTGVMTAVGAVFVYTLLGMGDREIAEALRITVLEVESVRAHSAYGETFNAIQAEFVSTNSELIQSRIAAMAHLALDTVEDIIVDGEMEGNRLKASIDTLDRAGARPVDNAKRSQGTNELRIVVTDGEKQVDVQINGQIV